jgi:hypothetical protein
MNQFVQVVVTKVEINITVYKGHLHNNELTVKQNIK